MRTIFRNSSFAFVTFLTILIAACSGGGGGGGGTPPPDTNVAGSVVKGIIKNATVDIYAIANGQIGTSPLTSVTTNNDGSYTFTLASNFSGPVMIEVHNNSSNNATMTCDNVSGCAGGASGYAFGEDMPLGNIVLKTYVSNVVGGSAQTASITPLTLMAAAYLDNLVTNSQAAYNAEGIANANSQMGNLLSINNIIITTPPDITNASAADADINSLKYALLSAAITAIAQQDYSGDISAAIDALVNSITTAGHEGQLPNIDLGNDSDTVSLTELLDSAKTLSSTLPIDFTYSGSVTSELSNLITLAINDTNEWTSAEPSPTSGLGELDTVKAFVADVRTWGHVIEEEVNSNTGQLEQRLDAAGTTIDIAAPLLTEAFDYALNAALEAFAQGQDIDLTTYQPDPLNPVTATGTASITDSTVTVIGAVNGTDVNVVVVFPSDLIGTEFTVSVTSATVGNDQAEIVVTQPGSVTLYFDESVDLSSLPSGDPLAPIPNPVRISLDITVGVNELNVANAVSFEGALQLDIVGSKGDGDTVIKDITGEVVYVNPSSVSISGSLTTGTNSFTANASATMPNADSFMPNNFWYPGIASYSFTGTTILTIEDFQGYYRTITFNEGDGTVTVYNLTPWYEWGYTANGTYADLAAFLDSGDYAVETYWTYVAGIGEYDIALPQQASDWDPAGGSLDGILENSEVSEENAANFRLISDVSISFNAQLDNLPAATFSLTGNRTGFEDGSLELNIAYGNRSIHAAGNIAQGDATGTVTITNQDGVVLTIDLDSTTQTGSVMYDQTEYATIENVNGVNVIRYIDGYFETF